MTDVQEDRDAIDALPLYTLKTELTAGLIVPEKTDVIVIPRQAFVEVATSVVDFYCGRLKESTRDALLKTARTQHRFALSEYFANRGCGCLVGEHLIAAGLTRSIGASLGYDATETWAARLVDEHDAHELMQLGARMDQQLILHLMENGIEETPDFGVVFIRDEDGIHWPSGKQG